MAPRARLGDNAQQAPITVKYPVLFQNHSPRYLPHLKHPETLQMGLSPLAAKNWIETDTDLAHYHRHKIRQRQVEGDKVYRADAASIPAQLELAQLLLLHLGNDQKDLYQVEGELLRSRPGDFLAPLTSEEPLWNCSLWVADDLVIMEKRDNQYCLSAASLCCPSHWRLEEKFGRPMREIHDPIPGFHRALTPRIDRFFEHIKPRLPVVRYNWSLQAHDQLNQRPDREPDAAIAPETPLFYRSERQSLSRLPETGAIAFTIRVYLHRLDTLTGTDNALAALFAAIDTTPEPLARYKGFDTLAPALNRYRDALPGLQA